MTFFHLKLAIFAYRAQSSLGENGSKKIINLFVESFYVYEIKLYMKKTFEI